jgi:hypothetical protein
MARSAQPLGRGAVLSWLSFVLVEAVVADDIFLFYYVPIIVPYKNECFGELRNVFILGVYLLNIVTY